jgi:hypothetical protein
MHFGFVDLISLHGINMFRPLMWPSSGCAVQTVPSLNYPDRSLTHTSRTTSLHKLRPTIFNFWHVIPVAVVLYCSTASLDQRLCDSNLWSDLVTFYLYLYSCSQHPEDGHMRDRNMSVAIYKFLIFLDIRKDCHGVLDVRTQDCHGVLDVRTQTVMEFWT